MNEVIKIIKNIILIGLVLTLWLALSATINILPWNILTDILTIVYQIIKPLDFMINCPLIYTLIGYRILIDLALWTWSMSIKIIYFFK
jgi:hypothetical protein